MKAAVSNIAWPAELTEDVYRLLPQYGFTGVEFAPGLLFTGSDDPFCPTNAEVDAVSKTLSAYQLELVSMQSLLFGCEGAFLFGNKEELDRFRGQMRRAIELASRLSVGNIVFGSPKNRFIPDGLDREAAFRQAADEFMQLGDVALKNGVQIAMEPNPVQYGANFLVSMKESGDFVAELSHPAITLNFDLGALALCGETDKMETYFDMYTTHISHVHVSEPHLAPAPATRDIADRISELVIEHDYPGWISIEMRPPPGAILQEIEKCLARLAGKSKV